MAEKIIIYDQFNKPFELPKRLDDSSQAAIGEKVDRWGTTSVVRDITPDLYVRVMRNTSPLWEKQALCDRIYYSGHFFAIGSDRASTICGWDWSIQPFTDHPGEKAKPDDVKVAEDVAEMIYGTANLSQYFEHLAWGELYFAAAAETIWNTSTYRPVRFELADGVRLNWWKNQLQLLTEAEPATGEPLKPWNWTVHSLNLQNPHKSRLARANAFWHLLTSLSVIDYAGLSERYNKATAVGYFTDDSQRDALVEALLQIGEQCVGAFPAGTKVDMLQAIAASKDIVEGLTKFGYDQSTKATCGHVLIVEAKSGSGTLGGNGAQMTNQKVAKGVGSRVGDSVRQGLIRPLVWFHHGAKFINRLPGIQFKARNAQEDKLNAEAHVAWNQALEPTGLAIDPEYLRETGGFPALVKRSMLGVQAPQAADPKAAADPAQPAADDGAPPPSTEAGIATTTTNALTGIALDKVHTALLDVASGLLDPAAAIILIKGAGFSIEDATAMVEAQGNARPASPSVPAATTPAAQVPAAQRATRQSSMSDSAPKIRTVTDVIATSTLIGQKTQRDRAKEILARAQQAADDGLSIEEFRDSLWEEYDSLDTTKSAELLTQGMVVSDAIATANAAVRAGR